MLARVVAVARVFLGLRFHVREPEFVLASTDNLASRH